MGGSSSEFSLTSKKQERKDVAELGIRSPFYVKKMNKNENFFMTTLVLGTRRLEEDNFGNRAGVVRNEPGGW